MSLKIRQSGNILHAFKLEVVDELVVTILIVEGDDKIGNG